MRGPFSRLLERAAVRRGAAAWLIFGSIALPLGVLAIVTTRESYRELRAAAELDLERVVRLASRLIASQVGDDVAFALWTASRKSLAHALETGDAAAAAAVADEGLRRGGDLSSIAVYGADGRRVAAAPEDAGPPTLGPFRDDAARAAEQDWPAIGATTTGRDGKRFVPIVAAVKGDDRGVRGTVVAALPAEHIGQWARGAQLEAGVARVYDIAGLEIVSTASEPGRRRDRVPSEAVAAALRGETGTITRQDAAGRDRLVAYAPIEPGESPAAQFVGAVTIDFDMTEALAPARRTAVRFVAFGAVLLAGAGVLGLALARALGEAAHSEVERVARERDLHEADALRREKDRILSIVAHELATPLTAMRGYARVAERHARESGDAKGGEHVSNLARQIERLGRLVHLIVEARRGVTEMKIAPTQFDLAELLADAVARHQAAAPARAYTLAAARPLPVELDRDRIEAVIENLLSNAAKYSPAEAPIDVEAHWVPGGEEVETSVADRGIGIPPSGRARLFEAFHRAENVGGTPGLGLGLHVSAAAVRRHGGEIEAEDRPGGGTVFRVRLPRRATATGATADSRILQEKDAANPPGA